MDRLECVALVLMLGCHCRLPSVANLNPIFVLRQFVDLLLREGRVGFREFPEVVQLVIFDISAVLLGEEIFIDPIVAASGEDDGAVQILAQSFFEDSAAEIVGVAEHYLTDGGAQLVVGDVSFLRRFGEPCRLKEPLGWSGLVCHESSVAPGATASRWRVYGRRF